INRSSQPAFHGLCQIGIDAELHIIGLGPFDMIGGRDDKRWLGLRFSSPPELPIFKELDPSSDRMHLYSFSVGFPYRLGVSGGEPLLELRTIIQTPGFSAADRWIIHFRGWVLRMCPPGHPLNPVGGA